MKSSMKKSITALVMAVVVAVSLLGYGCGKPASAPTTGADGSISGEFMGTAKGFGGDVTVTLTLTEGKITGCTAEADAVRGGPQKHCKHCLTALKVGGFVDVGNVHFFTFFIVIC